MIRKNWSRVSVMTLIRHQGVEQEMSVGLNIYIATERTSEFIKVKIYFRLNFLLLVIIKSKFC